MVRRTSDPWVAGTDSLWPPGMLRPPGYSSRTTSPGVPTSTSL